MSGAARKKLSGRATRSLVVSRAGWEEIGDFYKKLAAKWREHLKKDEAALGLGLADAGAAHTPAASKKALVRLLNWFKTRIEAHPDTDYKFSLATRKRRADAGMSKADWDAKKKARK